jgi:hypothetical protein
MAATSKHPNDIPMPDPDQPFLTRLECCRLGRISTSTFDRARKQKRLTVHYNGNRVIVENPEFRRYLMQEHDGSPPTDETHPANSPQIRP